MRSLSQVSMLNYLDIKPKLTERESWVLEAIEEIYPACAEQVATHLGVPINVISGRMTGLKNKRKIIKAYRGFNLQGRPVDYWKPFEQEYEALDAG